MPKIRSKVNRNAYVQRTLEIPREEKNIAAVEKKKLQLYYVVVIVFFGFDFVYSS
jgi:hypothetical protein